MDYGRTVYNVNEVPRHNASALIEQQNSVASLEKRLQHVVPQPSAVSSIGTSTPSNNSLLLPSSLEQVGLGELLSLPTTHEMHPQQPNTMPLPYPQPIPSHPTAALGKRKRAPITPHQHQDIRYTMPPSPSPAPLQAHKKARTEPEKMQQRLEGVLRGVKPVSTRAKWWWHLRDLQKQTSTGEQKETPSQIGVERTEQQPHHGSTPVHLLDHTTSPLDSAPSYIPQPSTSTSCPYVYPSQQFSQPPPQPSYAFHPSTLNVSTPQPAPIIQHPPPPPEPAPTTKRVPKSRLKELLVWLNTSEDQNQNDKNT